MILCTANHYINGLLGGFVHSIVPELLSSDVSLKKNKLVKGHLFSLVRVHFRWAACF